MDSVLADLRYAIRNIGRRPGFSTLAILTLAAGIGINTVAFTAVNSLLFHPFTFAGVARLGWIMLSTPGNPHGALSFDEFSTLGRGARAFDIVAAEGRQPLGLTTDGQVEQAWALLVSADYFRALDARPESGRVLDATDLARTDLVAVVSHRFHERRLGGGSIAGRTIVVANRTVSIVGVLPDDFRGPGGLYAPDMWLSLERAAAYGLPARLLSNDERWLTAIARLAPDAKRPQADADLAAIAGQFPRRDGREVRTLQLGFFPMRDGHPEVRGLASFVWAAMAIVGLVLLIACFNVAALLLARATERRREIGIRTALGAGRGRIIRQLVTEGLVLSTLSGVAALVMASWSGSLLEVFSLPAPIPQRLQLGVDARLVLFTAVVVVIAGVLPGLLPALQATRRNVFASMRLDGGSGSGRPSRVRNVFVTAQITGSTLFLATALLFARSFLNANASDPGFNTEQTVVAQMEPSLYGFEGARARDFIEQAAARVANTPGVAVAIADRAPFYVGFPRVEKVSTATLDCTSAECRPTLTYAVGRGYFDALGIPLRAGRDFSDAEIKIAGAIVVNETMAAALWPGRSPLGELVRLGAHGAPVPVVGVTADITDRSFGQARAPVFYRPIEERDMTAGVTLVARSAAPPAIAIAAIRDAVRSLAPAMPIASVTTMKERLTLPLWPRRTAAGFLLICGGLALLLATVGLFGVTYFAVRQRMREFGVRIALGAGSSDIVRQVLREGVWLAVPGAAIGLVLAAIAARIIAGTLLGVSPSDPASFGATAAIQTAVTLLACALPALRATQADPMIALRDDN